MAIARRYWKDIASSGAAFFISKNMKQRRDPVPLHDHDFAEILLVSEGRAAHTVNRRKFIMEVAHLAMILPEDTHQVEALEDRPMSLIVVGFPTVLMREFRDRYPKDAAIWFPREGDCPAHIHLDDYQYQRFMEEFQWLSHAPRTKRVIDTFCLNFLRLLSMESEIEGFHRIPPWLRAALREFSQNKDHPGGSLEHFFALCQRRPEHVSRVMREHMNITPSAWVNRHRIQNAARLLVVSNASVLDVAAECGFDNAGYFHRLFQKHFNTTPARYRKEHRRGIEY